MDVKQIEDDALTHPTAYGKVMKDWAAVPKSLLAHTAELKKYFDLSFQHAAKVKTKGDIVKKK
jgi:hypothetical protein